MLGKPGVRPLPFPVAFICFRLAWQPRAAQPAAPCDEQSNWRHGLLQTMPYNKRPEALSPDLLRCESLDVCGQGHTSPHRQRRLSSSIGCPGGEASMVFLVPFFSHMMTFTENFSQDLMFTFQFLHESTFYYPITK